MTCLFVILVIYHLQATLTYGHAMQLQGMGSEQPALNGLVFSQHILFQHRVLTAIECGALCLKYKCCATFTLLSNVSSSLVRECRGHDQLMTSDSPNIIVPGSRTSYMTRPRTDSSWLNTLCSIHSDCLAKNSVCQDQCVCKFGYYYSHCRDSCIPSCPSANLQATFVQYRQSSFNNGNSPTVSTRNSPEECQEQCLQTAGCRTLAWNLDARQCYLNVHVPSVDAVSQLSSVDAISVSSCDECRLYQRTCL